MKNINPIQRLGQLFAVATLLATPLAQADVTVTNYTPGATAWPGTPLVATTVNPSGATVSENFTGGGGNTNLSETFVITANSKLDKILVYGTPAGGTVTLNLYDLGVQTAPAPSPYTTNIVGANLLGGGAGLTIAALPSAGSAQIIEFAFGTNGTVDTVLLSSNRMYVFEITSSLGSTAMFWNRFGADPYASGAAYRNQSWINGNSARDFALAVYTSATNAPVQLFPVTVNYSPTNSYGPPPVWPGNSAVSILPTIAGYTDQGFLSSLLGETFLITNPIVLSKVHLAGGITGPGTGPYRVHLYNLGAGGTWTTFGNTFNPSSYPDMLTPLSFTPTNTTKTVIELAFDYANQVVLTNGNYMFALEFVGTGNNNFIWERSGGGVTYTNGVGYSGTTSSAANSAFGAAVRTFIMDVEPTPPPVLQIRVTSSAVGSAWPGDPMVRTFEDPSQPDANAGTRVAETFTAPAGRVVAMSFAPTNDFKLGAVAIRGIGGGSTNVNFRVSLYHITNNAGYASNYRPSTEAESLLRANLSFRTSAAGTNDFILMLQFTNSADNVQLYSSNNYSFEISRDFPGVDDGALLWIRGTGGISAYDPWPGFLPTPRGFEVGGGTSPLYTSANLRTPIAGSIRDLVMAVYASIEITSVTHTGNNTDLTWNSSNGSTYSVLRKTNVDDPTWTTIASGLPSGGTSTTYTDTTATGSTSFYKISSP